MTHLSWCDPSRCSLPVHSGGAEAHRSAPIHFGAHSGYLYQTRGANGRWHPRYFIAVAGCGAELSIAVDDLRLLVELIDELNARTYSPPEVAKVAAALLSPDEEA